MSDPRQNPNEQQRQNQPDNRFAGAPTPGAIDDPVKDEITIGRTALMLLVALVLFMILIAVIPFFIHAIAFIVDTIRSIFSVSHGPLFYDKDYRLGALAMVLIAATAVVIAAIRRR